MREKPTKRRNPTARSDTLSARISLLKSAVKQIYTVPGRGAAN